MKDRLYIISICCLIIFLLIREGCNQRHTDKLISDISNYKTDAETYKTKLGLDISTNNALALETQEQVKTLMATNDTLKQWVSKFKEIKGGVIIKETTIIKEVAVPFDKLIPCDFKPFPANKITKDYLFYTTVANTGLTIDSLKIPNESRIIIGDRREGFLKLKTSLVVDVNNSNPYIQTSNISGYIYEPKKKWYEKMWVNFAVGAGVGFVGSQFIKK
jgi:hypothetical protein